MITISIPSKIHLVGEHSVVYGKPALLAAINRRMSVTVNYSKNKEVLGGQSYEKEAKQLLETLEKEIKKRIKLKNIKPYSIRISSQVPVGSGLGSSAALSAGFTACLLSLLEIPWDKKIVFDIAYTGEKFFHGNPSGGDLATVIEGGFLWFRKELDFLKTFSPLPFKPHKNIKQFILINSGKPKESTKEMIAKVSQLKTSFPQKIKFLFDSQEELTKQMVIALRDGDENSLIDYIKLGEQNLEKLGVVGKKAQTLIRKMEELEGAAKITGAGGIKDGSGMLLVYHKDSNILKEISLKLNLPYIKVMLGGEGLRRDE